MSSFFRDFMSSNPGYPSSSGSEKYIVILIFNQEDSSEIPVTDLCQSLGSKNIEFSFFDEKLEIIRSLSSRLAVVVVSKSYPTSVLCLNQLLTIVNTYDEGYISVLPVFYGVDPLYVRNQTGEFEEPFRKLGKENPAEKVQAWRRALTKLTNIIGMDSRYWSKGDKVTDLITDEILSVIRNYNWQSSLSPIINLSSIKHEGLVGIDRQVQVLYELLDLKATKEVRVIGIWGLGGIGKTTLARYVYKQMSSSFHAHMFVDDLKMVYTDVGDETEHVSTGVIKSTVGHRKGLLVIDSVNNKEQLKGIAEILSWCSSGSRVILITQDKNLLDEFGVEHVYEVKSLRYDEALELFSISAFKKLIPPTPFRSLSLRAVEIASFLPLTLKILGSSLQGKNEEDWEKELQKLEGDEEKTIMEIMKKSHKLKMKKRPNRSFYLA